MKYNKIDYLEYSLNTQVTWIKSADTKASVLLAVIAAFFALCDHLDIFTSTTYINKCYYLIFIIISMLLITVGTLSFLFTIMPSLKITKANGNSYLYFGSIQHMDKFQSKLKRDLDNKFDPADDFLNQIKINAGIANTKMKKLKFGAWFLTIGLMIFAISVIIESLV